MGRKNILIWGCFIFLIGVLEFFPSISWSAAYYVDYTVSPGGSGTKGSPFKTIPATLAAGDIVYLKRGVTYNASYTFANSGTQKVRNTDGSHTAGGNILASSTTNFSSAGVTTADHVFINGEGWYGISAVGTTTLTLTSTTKHTASSVGFCVGNNITITIDETWGTGNAVVQGTFYLTGRDYIVVDGVIANGIEFTKSGYRFFEGTNSSYHYGIILRNLYMHDNYPQNLTTSDWGATKWEYISHSLFQNLVVKDIGTAGTSLLWGTAFQMYSAWAYTTFDNVFIEEVATDGIEYSGANECYIQNSEISFAGWVRGVASGDVHADAIQGTGYWSDKLTIRYNKIHDNADNSQIGATHYYIYNNIFYDTIPPGQPHGTPWPGSEGIRTDYGSYGEIYNNIIAFNIYNGIHTWTSAGPCKGPVIIKNNIFYENDDGGGGGPEVVLNSGCTSGSSLDYNLYIRKDKQVTNDKIISWGGTTYTLAQARAIGLETNGKKCTVAGCDWVWNSPPVFNDSTRSNPNFYPYASNSPQVPNIGAFQYAEVEYTLSVPSPPSDLVIK